MSTAALTMALVLAVGACSEESDSDGAATGTTSGESSTGGTDGSPTDSPATGQTTPGDTATEEPAGQAVLSVQEATAAAAQALTAARLAETASGEQAQQARQQAYGELALRGARGAVALRDVEPGVEPGDPLIEPTDANVLAISRDDGQFPWLILVQTVPDAGQPVLHLLGASDEDDDFTILNSAPMLPGTEVGTFHPRSVGSPVIREGQAELAVDPTTLLTDFAAMLDTPRQRDELTDIRTSGFAPQVRQAAQEQAEEVEVQAAFTQRHRPLLASIRAIEREDGSALVFGVLERTDIFQVRDGMTLNAPERFTAFVEGEDEITERAVMTTLEYVVIEVPAGEGPASLLAVREQLVDAEGQ